MVDLDELERLEREATPRPWEHERMGSIVADVAGVRRQVASVLGNAAMHGDVEREPYDIRDATSEMIVATRNALPDLIAELRTLRARVAELERDARLGAAVREAVIYGAAWAENARFYNAKIIDPVECAAAASEAAGKAVEIWRAAQKGGSDAV